MAQEWHNDVTKVTTYHTTGATGLDESINPPTGGFKFLDLRLHCVTSPATTENRVVKVNAKDGSNYDVTLLIQDMNAVDDVYLPYADRDLYLREGDTIDVDWTNTNTVTWGLLVRYQRLR